VGAVNTDAPTDDEEAPAGTDTPSPAPLAAASGNHQAPCICKFTPGGHRLRRRQREGAVQVSRRTVRSLNDLLCSVFKWDSLSLWRRELSVWASRYEEACWTRRALVSVFFDDVVFPSPPPESVVHRCRASAARIVGAFFDECDVNEVRRCKEHSHEAMDQDEPYIESNPFFYD